jgi:hypothetical protein
MTRLPYPGILGAEWTVRETSWEYDLETLLNRLSSEGWGIVYIHRNDPPEEEGWLVVAFRVPNG